MSLLVLKIEIDYGLPNARAVSQNFLNRMANLAHSQWATKASTRFKRTQADYIQGIQRPQVSDGEAVISLVGWLPTKLEVGMEAFDQKPGLLSHRGNGRFVIPFEHQTPSSKGMMAPPMPADIYATLVAQGRVTKLDAGNTGMMSKLNSLVGAPSAPQGSYTYKVSPYAGMKQSQQKGSRGGVTFRTVSRNSDPGAFIHPGIRAANLRREVVDFLTDQAPKVFKAALKSMSGVT